MTISCGFSSTTYGRVVSTRYLRTKLTIIQVRNVAKSANILIVDRLFPVMLRWVRSGIELAAIVVVVGLVTVDGHVRHLTHWIASTSILPLLT